jgi:hypothetical protein
VADVPIHLHLIACYEKRVYILTFQAYICVMVDLLIAISTVACVYQQC